MRYNQMLRFHDMDLFTGWWLVSEISVRPCKVSLCAKCVCLGVLTENVVALLCIVGTGKCLVCRRVVG